MEAAIAAVENVSIVEKIQIGHIEAAAIFVTAVTTKYTIAAQHTELS